ncbi:hypothetical protein BC829DRAFT_207449 [Chytridium lagenaria]|nr:hypothetical protein BC829DRAFT_207449 [Chytridium lagenaria]
MRLSKWGESRKSVAVRSVKGGMDVVVGREVDVEKREMNTVVEVEVDMEGVGAIPRYDVEDTREVVKEMSAVASTTELSVLFVPLREEISYGYFRLGAMIADWSSKSVAFLIILLFISLPDVSTWTRHFGNISAVELIVRFTTWPLFATVSEFLCTFVESRMLKLDFALCVDEFRKAGLSVAAFLYVISLVSGGVGILLIAETDIMGQTMTFQPGRRVWSI